MINKELIVESLAVHFWGDIEGIYILSHIEPFTAPRSEKAYNDKATAFIDRQSRSLSVWLGVIEYVHLLI